MTPPDDRQIAEQLEHQVCRNVVDGFRFSCPDPLRLCAVCLANAALAQLSEARRLVWEEAAREAGAWARKSLAHKHASDELIACGHEMEAFEQWLRQRALPSEQTETPR